MIDGLESTGWGGLVRQGSPHCIPASLGEFHSRPAVGLGS